MRGASIVGISVAAALLACAPTPQPSPLEPTIGHSQPLPPSPTKTEAAPAPVDPLVAPVVAPEPDPAPEPAEQPEPEPTSSEPAAEDEAPSIPPPAKVTAEDEELCTHITRVVLSESKDQSNLTGDQIDELIASCSVALAQDRRKLGKDEFRRRAACVRAAKSVEGFAGCKSQ